MNECAKIISVAIILVSTVAGQCACRLEAAAEVTAEVKAETTETTKYAAIPEAWRDYFGPVDAQDVQAQAALLAMLGEPVGEVSDGSVAQRSGLQVGDIIVGLDGMRIYGISEYNLLQWRTGVRPSDKMLVEVWRAGAIVKLLMQPKKFRLLGFNSDLEGIEDRFCQRLRVLSKGVVTFDTAQTKLAWAQFPRRYAIDLLQWLDKGQRTADELKWLKDLNDLYVALCSQEFAAAAQIAAVHAPTPRLQQLADFYYALAQRHKDKEQAPDPAALGVSLVTYVNIYPYPLHVTPATGNLSPELADLERLLNLVRFEPVRYFPQHEQDISKVLPGSLWEKPQKDTYLTKLQLTWLIPERHHHIVYVSPLVQTPKYRKRLLAYLHEQQEKQEQSSVLLQYALAIVTYVDERNNSNPAALQQVIDAMLALKKTSPALAFKGMQDVALATDEYCAWNVRQVLREACLNADFQTTAKPSVFLDYINQRDAWLPFYFVHPYHYNFLGELNRVYKALSYEKTIHELETVVDAVNEETPLAQRRELLSELIDRYQGWIVKVDVERIQKLVGAGKAMGILMDKAPVLLRSAERHPARASYLGPLWDVLRGEQFAYDYGPLQQGLQKLDWAADDCNAQIQELYMQYGGVFGVMQIADACRDHHKDEWAQDYYAKVAAYLKAERHVTKNWFKSWHATVLLDASLIYGASRYQTKRALDNALKQVNTSEASTEWNATPLIAAQAYLTSGDNQSALELFEMSFSGRQESGETQLFMWPDGVYVRGMHAQRHKILEMLQQRNMLTEQALTNLRPVVKPEYLNDASMAILGMDRPATKEKLEKDVSDF